MVIQIEKPMKRKLFLETFGCQMNQLDSELVLGQLRAQGYEAVPDRERADVIIYNTCSVREHAEQKVWSRLGELRDRKAREPGLVIGVIGCMAERDGVNLFKKYPHVDLLCGPGELDKLAGMVHNAAVAATAVADGDALTDRQGDMHGGRQVALMGATARRSSTLEAAVDNLELLDLSRSISPGEMPAQAYVRITRGCNKFCTYCVVPHTRGPEVHRPPTNIIEEVKRLVASGVREVTLLGQTVNHYSHIDESGRKTTFADLLYQVHKAVPDLPRLRFVTSFPRDFSNEALQAMRDCPRICRYLHIPAQSGSDRILRLMNRSYTAESYRDLIQRAREMMPDICLASDFIVGFPTETDADFAATVELLRDCRFKNSFIFKYSPRPGTVAIDRHADDVPEEIKRRRNSELLEAQRQVSEANNSQMIGVRTRVLVESQSRLAQRPVNATSGAVELGWERRSAAAVTEMVQLIGRTAGDQIVAFDGDPDLVGELVDIEITSARSLTLFGRIL
jgi:tRNA-2-methylthio-N6-dimethylallyladenosine synthase